MIDKVDLTHLIKMKGSGGNMDYVVFARKENTGLAVKIQGISEGTDIGYPGHTWFGARIRAAKLDAQAIYSSASDSETNVISLKPKSMDLPASFFPNVNWLHSNNFRASAMVETLVKGIPVGTKEQQVEFKAAIEGGMLSTQMAKYLIELAGDAELLLTEEVLASYLESVFQPFFNMLNKVEEINTSISNSAEAIVGKFGVRSDALKKAAKKIEEFQKKNTTKNSDEKPPVVH